MIFLRAQLLRIGTSILGGTGVDQLMRDVRTAASLYDQ